MARNVGFQCKCCIAFANRESLGNSIKHYHKSRRFCKATWCYLFSTNDKQSPSYNLIVLLKQAKQRFFSEGEEEGGSSRNNFLTFCI